MDLDDQFRRFFGTDDFSSITPAALAGGIEKMQVDLGLESDPGRRFALWSLLHMLDAAPDLDVAFEDADERNAARAFMEMMEKAQPRAT